MKMSLSKKIVSEIDNAISNFLNRVSSQYELNVNDLRQLWEGEIPDLTQTDMTDLSLARLSKCSKNELSALCKSKAMKCTGTKEELMNRLMGAESGKTGKAEKTPKSPAKSKKKNVDSSVVETLKKQISCIPIRQNAHGNYEHPET